MIFPLLIIIIVLFLLFFLLFLSFTPLPSSSPRTTDASLPINILGPPVISTCHAHSRWTTPTLLSSPLRFYSPPPLPPPPFLPSLLPLFLSLSPSLSFPSLPPVHFPPTKEKSHKPSTITMPLVVQTSTSPSPFPSGSPSLPHLTTPCTFAPYLSLPLLFLSSSSSSSFSSSSAAPHLAPFTSSFRPTNTGTFARGAL